MNKFFTQKNNGLVSHEAKGFRSGFTLVETLVAISIFTVALLAMMSVLASGISNTAYTKQKMLATYLAQEGIEYIRNMRDNYVLYPIGVNGWPNFKAKLASCNFGDECGFNTLLLTTDSNFIQKCVSNPSICKIYIDNSNGSYSTNPAGAVTGFTRKVWMTNADGSSYGGGGNSDEVKIFTKVEWTQGSGAYSITFSENLFNWVE